MSAEQRLQNDELRKLAAEEATQANKSGATVEVSKNDGNVTVAVLPPASK